MTRCDSQRISLNNERIKEIKREGNGEDAIKGREKTNSFRVIQDFFNIGQGENRNERGSE
jgi:hypothetical protein